MDWKIKQGNEACSQCSHSFDLGEVYYSTVRLEEHDIQRFDFCASCFTKEADPEREAFWRTKMTSVKPQKKSVNFEVLRDLFFKMLDAKDRQIKELAYLIALILIRKRYLRLKDFISHAQGDYMAIQQKKGAPVMKMEVPLLNMDDIARLRDQLAELLDADLDGTLEISELRDRISKPSPEPDSDPTS